MNLSQNITNSGLTFVWNYQVRMAKNCHFVWHVHFLSVLGTTVGSTVWIQLLILWVIST